MSSWVAPKIPLSHDYQTVTLPFTASADGFLSVDVNMKEDGNWYCYIYITGTSGNYHTERYSGKTTYADTFDIQMKKGEIASIKEEGGTNHVTTFYFKSSI